MRRTSDELVKYIETILARKGDSAYHMCQTIGVSIGKYVMQKRNKYDPRIGMLIDIVQYLGISFDELIGLKESEQEILPHDIAEMVFMLKHIPEKDRKLISMNIKNSYDIAMSETK